LEPEEPEELDDPGPAPPEAPLVPDGLPAAPGELGLELEEDVPLVPDAPDAPVSAPRRSHPATAKLMTAAVINRTLEGENFSFMVFLSKSLTVYALDPFVLDKFLNFSEVRVFSSRQFPCQPLDAGYSKSKK
jgi:hypothetical protein